MRFSLLCHSKIFFAIFALFCVSPSVCFAYLDPGSGSLLLSSVVAIFASILFTAKNIFYKIKGLIIGGGGQYHISSLNTLKLGKNLSKSTTPDFLQNKSLSSIVFYCEGTRYYGSFKPILDALDSLKHPYTYLTSDETDPALKRESNNFSIKEYIGIDNQAYTRLNLLQADICVLTTPSLQVLQIKRSKGVRHYCHIMHSLTPMTYRTFGVDYFDSVLVANKIQGDFVREIEKAHSIKAKHIAIVGSTYLDELAKLRENLKSSIIQTSSVEVSLSDFVGCEATSKEIGLESIDEVSSKSPAKAPKRQSCPTILISPSWGKETLLSKYGMRLLEPLAKSPYHIIIRPHPQSLIGEVESSNIKNLKDLLKSYSNVEWDIGTPNVLAFAKADLMISDFSSVIFDFVCLEGKPVITLDFTFDSAGYDLADIYDSSNISQFWTFRALKRIGEKLKETDLPQIAEKIARVLKSKEQKPALSEVKNELWQFPYNSGMQATMELLKIEREILEWRLSGYAGELSRIRALDSMLEAHINTHT